MMLIAIKQGRIGSYFFVLDFADHNTGNNLKNNNTILGRRTPHKMLLTVIQEKDDESPI